MEKKDEKSSIKDKLLEKLMEYGDSVLEDKKRYKTKTKKRKLMHAGAEEQDTSNDIPGQNKKKKRKQKKGSLETENCEHDETQPLQQDVSEMSSKEKQLFSFKSELGILDYMGSDSVSMATQSEDNSPANSSSLHHQMKQKNRHQPEIIIFENSHKKKKKTLPQVRKSLDTDEGEEEEQRTDFDLKKARLEVQRFGIKGFDKTEKDEAMKAFLIKLGAKPPKNTYVNYKELMEMKKAKVNKSEGNSETSSGKKSRRQKNNSRKRERDDKIKGFLDGQIGRYKGGVQMVSKDEIKHTKSKGRKR